MPLGIYTFPKTYSAGALVSASDRNVYERDNLNYLYEVPAAGLSGNQQLGSQSIPPNTWTVLTILQEATHGGSEPEFFDTDDMTTGGGRITVPETAVYVVSGHCSYDGLTGTAQHVLGVFGVDQTSGLDTFLFADQKRNFSSFGIELNVTGIAQVTAGDHLELRTFHNHTSERLVQASIGVSLPAEFSVVRVRDGV